MVRVNCCKGDGNPCTTTGSAIFLRRGVASIVDEGLLEDLVGDVDWSKASSEPVDEGGTTELSLVAERLLSEKGRLTAFDLGLELRDSDADYIVVHCSPCRDVCKVRVPKD